MKLSRADKARFTSLTLLFSAGLLVALLFSQCTKKEKTVFKRYEGPQEEIFDVGVKYSERGKVTVHMKTPSQFRYLNGDKVFPDSINVVFYDTLGTTTTRIRSDSGRFDNAKNIYTVIGNVVVQNLQTEEYLYTTELNWNPATRKVYNDKSNKILQKTKGTVLNGVGLTANQDFTETTMLKITGIVPFSQGDLGMSGAPMPGPSSATPSANTDSEGAKKDTLR